MHTGIPKKEPAQRPNPRRQNGALRRKYRERFKAMGAPCGICKGRLGAIHYDEPSDSQHPLSCVIDEVIPVSKWKQYGYSSAREAAEDWTNLQAAHYICNRLKGNKINFTLQAGAAQRNKKIMIDGKW